MASSKRMNLLCYYNERELELINEKDLKEIAKWIVNQFWDKILPNIVGGL